MGDKMNTARRRLKAKTFRFLGRTLSLAGDGLYEIKLRRAASWCWEQSGYCMARYWYG